MPVEGSKGDAGPELLLRPPVRGAGPLAGQVEATLRDAIRAGRLRPGGRLPPSRTLAQDLGVSRRLVVGAYEQLVAEGWLEGRVGAGTFVRGSLPSVVAPPARPDRRTARPTAPADAHRPVALDFFPGHPDLSAFPRAAWARVTRDALRELPDAAFGYGDPRGLWELREALSVLLARTRGVVCRPGQIVVCQGVVQGLRLLAHALAGEADGARAVRIAVEDPYLREHLDVLQAAGADLVPVPVDDHGVRDDAVARAGVDAVLLTPAHQCPSGVVLGAARRAALAGWARREGTLLVEDDYDAEYRYDRAPVAALQGLAPDHVAYLGSVSKTLAPALRLAWLVVPEGRLAAVVAAKRYADAGSPVLEQAALARFIAGGGYDRHVRAARRRQRERRDALVDAVARRLPEATVEGVAAGLQAVVRLPEDVDAAAVQAAALARGVRVYPLSAFRADPPPRTHAFVMGYGALAPPAIETGVRLLAEALVDVSASRGPSRAARASAESGRIVLSGGSGRIDRPDARLTSASAAGPCSAEF